MIISKHLQTEIATAISECEHDKIFVLTDETTHEKCWPVLAKQFGLRNAYVITIQSTDSHKDLTSLSHVWRSSVTMEPHVTHCSSTSVEAW